jgi:hypothetical protein
MADNFTQNLKAKLDEKAKSGMPAKAMIIDGEPYLRISDLVPSGLAIDAVLDRCLGAEAYQTVKTKTVNQ